MPSATPGSPQAEASLSDRLKVAGQIALKQAQRTKLATITLPAAYRALGKNLYGAKAYGDEFPDQYREFDQLTTEMKSIREGADARPAAEGFTAKAKAAATTAKDMAHTKSLELRVAQSLGRFGAAAYKRHGEQSGPPELVRAISDSQARIALLAAEISELSKSQPNSGRLITKKRVIIAVLIFIGLGIIGALTDQKKGHPETSRTPSALAQSSEPADKPLHPFFPLKPGFDYVYVRKWQAGPDQQVIRRHNSDESISYLWGGTEKEIEHFQYRIENGDLLETPSSGTKSTMHIRLLLQNASGRSWSDDDPGGYRIIHSCGEILNWANAPERLLQYNGHHCINLTQEGQVIDTTGGHSPVAVERQEDTFVEGLGLVRHEFQAPVGNRMYFEDLVDVVPSNDGQRDLKSDPSAENPTRKFELPLRYAGETAADYYQRLNPTNDPDISKMINDGTYTPEAAWVMRQMKQNKQRGRDNVKHDDQGK